MLYACHAPGATITPTPKLVVLHHQFYDHLMAGMYILSWPESITIHGGTSRAEESFPDPAGTGKVTYLVTISKATSQGITFNVSLNLRGSTYHLSISGVQVDDGVQIQLPAGDHLLRTVNEAQFVVAWPVLINKVTGEVVLAMHVTYQTIWKWA